VSEADPLPIMAEIMEPGAVEEVRVVLLLPEIQDVDIIV